MVGTTHTHFTRGKRIRITLHDGTILVDKFTEQQSKYLITEHHKIPKKSLKSVNIFKEQPHD
jgi:hypothetical protein